MTTESNKTESRLAPRDIKPKCPYCGNLVEMQASLVATVVRKRKCRGCDARSQYVIHPRVGTRLNYYDITATGLEGENK